MFSWKDRVSFSRIDYRGMLGVSGVMNALQDCCLFHSEEVGRSSQELLKKNRAWLVSSWHVIFHRYPKMGEEFITETWPYQFKGIFGSRSFAMKSMEDELLVSADSQWFYADVESGKPVRVDQDEIDAYPVEPALDMPKKSRKIKCPENLKKIEQLTVVQSYLDTNHHVNNGQYIRLAANVLPDDFYVEELRAEYRLAAHQGEQLYIQTAWVEEDFVVVITDQQDNPFFLCEFKGGIKR